MINDFLLNIYIYFVLLLLLKLKCLMDRTHREKPTKHMFSQRGNGALNHTVDLHEFGRTMSVAGDYYLH